MSDFETGLDGWTVNSAASISQSTIGAMSGSNSLLVQGVLPGAFQWAIQLNNNSLASVIEANPILKYDVTWVTSDWSADNGTWARVDTLAVNSDATGWKQTNDAMMTDSANPLYPGSWDPVNWGQQNTRTVAYDLSSLVGGASAASWFQLNLSINYDWPSTRTAERITSTTFGSLPYLNLPASSCWVWVGDGRHDAAPSQVCRPR